MSEQLTLYFVGLRDKNHRVTIQSAAAMTYDEAIEKVLAAPIMENIVAYTRMSNADELVWIDIDEQN
jgi:hypothetical protein